MASTELLQIVGPFVAILKHVANLNGCFTARQRDLLFRAASTFTGSYINDEEFAGSVWRLVEDPAIDEQDCIRAVAMAVNEEAFANSILFHAFQICVCKGCPTDSELKWLVAFARTAHLPDRLLQLRLLQFLGEPSPAETLSWEESLARLGLPESATQAEIREKYRFLCRQHHPDLHGNSPLPERQRQANLFKAITEAFEALERLAVNVKFSRARHSAALTEALPGLGIGCFFCENSCVLPESRNHIFEARCEYCLSLLTHPRDLAAVMLEVGEPRLAVVRPTKPKPARQAPPRRATRQASADPPEEIRKHFFGVVSVAILILAIVAVGNRQFKPSAAGKGPDIELLLTDVAVHEEAVAGLQAQSAQIEHELRSLRQRRDQATRGLDTLREEQRTLADTLASGEKRLAKLSAALATSKNELLLWMQANPNPLAAANESGISAKDKYLAEQSALIEQGFQERQEARRRQGARPADQGEIQAIHNKRKAVEAVAARLQDATARAVAEKLSSHHSRLAGAVERLQQDSAAARRLLIASTERRNRLPAEIAACSAECDRLPIAIAAADKDLADCRSRLVKAQSSLLAAESRLHKVAGDLAVR